MSETTPRNNLIDNSPPADIAAEFTILMSLALDNRMDAVEQRRFDALLVQYPELNDEWVEWQLVDQQLDSVPHMEPVGGFVHRFEMHLAAYEQSRQQRVLGISLVAALLVAIAAASAWVSTGAFVLSTQGPWIGEQIRNFAYFSVALSNWFTAFVDTLAGLANSPLAQTLGFVYTIVAIMMICGWVLLLRRSAHLSDATAVPGLE